MNTLPASRLGKWFRLGGAALVGTGLLGLILWLTGAQVLRPGPAFLATEPQKIVLALPLQLSSGALLVAQDRGYFNSNGIDVTLQPFMLGKQAWNSVLQGSADLAVMADTPFMLAVMRGEKIALVTSLYGSRNAMAIVARKDRGIASAHDLAGKTIATMFGTNTHYFLDKMLMVHGVARASVTVVNLSPHQIAAALQSGEIDAATLWQPMLSNVVRAMGNRVVTLYGQDIFVFRFVLVGTPEYIDHHPTEVRRLVAAIADANRYIAQQPVAARSIMETAIGIDSTLLPDAFEAADFELGLDQSLLLALDDETRWAIRTGIVSAAPVPNYLTVIRQQALDAVLPSANQIIR